MGGPAEGQQDLSRRAFLLGAGSGALVAEFGPAANAQTSAVIASQIATNLVKTPVASWSSDGPGTPRGDLQAIKATNPGALNTIYTALTAAVRDVTNEQTRTLAGAVRDENELVKRMGLLAQRNNANDIYDNNRNYDTMKQANDRNPLIASYMQQLRDGTPPNTMISSAQLSSAQGQITQTIADQANAAGAALISIIRQPAQPAVAPGTQRAP